MRAGEPVGALQVRILHHVRAGKTPEEVEALLAEEIAKAAAEPVTEKELDQLLAS